MKETWRKDSIRLSNQFFVLRELADSAEYDTSWNGYDISQQTLQEQNDWFRCVAKLQHVNKKQLQKKGLEPYHAGEALMWNPWTRTVFIKEIWFITSEEWNKKTSWNWFFFNKDSLICKENLWVPSFGEFPVPQKHCAKCILVSYLIMTLVVLWFIVVQANLSNQNFVLSG